MLLQSLLTRVNGTRSSIRRIRDWMYRLTSNERRVLLLCAADFKGRIRRSMVPVIVTIFYTTVKGAVKQSEEIAWSYLQGIISRMTLAFRIQVCHYITSYRKLGYFRAYNLGPTRNCLNDNYLRVCNDLLSDFPQFLWHDLYLSLTERLKITQERRRSFLNTPMESRVPETISERYIDDREFDEFSFT
ncbi:uncharacterized protein LOC100907498 [Galendromus occidentalis]|uniref:Uncharacterized protein LOC100907498 n=1 Tax=Galendromus occidentalis TaxID=34638 RepID=A0AAJ6QPW7_9ACAR|nr:uncharacterized protein LOC100907498 [Galendromus occidentalis]